MTHTRIKFCGLTRDQDMRLAVELGVDYVGLVFAPRSARRLSLQQARRLRELVPGQVGVVALVMDNSAEEVATIIEHVAPDLLQFHGQENDAFCAGFGLPFLKAIAMGGEARDAREVAAEFPSAYGYLFDGHARGEQGGSGQRFDWQRLPQGLERPSFLAGGLEPGNVVEAMHVARPWGLDVSSGIEASPGIKDADKMRGFVQAVRTYAV